MEDGYDGKERRERRLASLKAASGEGWGRQECGGKSKGGREWKQIGG